MPLLNELASRNICYELSVQVLYNLGLSAIGTKHISGRDMGPAPVLVLMSHGSSGKLTCIKQG